MNCTPKVGHDQQKGCSFIMTRYSLEERTAAVQAVEAGESIGRVAERYQIDRTVLERSVRLYHEHGEKGLRSNAYNWTAEQKYQILEYMHENYLSCNETAIHFGISGSSTVWQWEQRYLEKGIEGLEGKKKGRKPRTPKPKPPKTREEELLDRIQYLEAENEYLKKLNALVAEREKRERGNG
ncbi:MAG: helix-turn-helix domain-containing protein [Anaerolineaceae bacterium]